MRLWSGGWLNRAKTEGSELKGRSHHCRALRTRAASARFRRLLCQKSGARKTLAPRPKTAVAPQLRRPA
eukprot:1878290-Pyramimonas_sp.AAC.1